MSAASSHPMTGGGSATPTPAAAAASTGIVASEINVPSEKTLKHAARIAIEKDMPILLDYYNDTAEGKAFLGEDATTKAKMLVRSGDEFTSLIQKIFKVAEDFIVITENSVYIISGSTKKKTITVPTE